MKRQILTLIAVLTLVVAGALFAQSGGYGSPAPSTQPSAQQPSSVPPSQQVDETGKPETGPGPDVDVDVGRNAEDGVMDVDVNRTTDPDTAAEGNDHPGTHTPGTTTGTAYDNDTTTDVSGDTDNLPDTGSEMPLVGLIGLLALGAALIVRSVR